MFIHIGSVVPGAIVKTNAQAGSSAIPKAGIYVNAFYVAETKSFFANDSEFKMVLKQNQHGPQTAVNIKKPGALVSVGYRYAYTLLRDYRG
jgi:hypothetical protein